MPLTDREKERLKAMIDAGEPLPPKYLATLFAEPHGADPIWPGKTLEVASVALPFQSIEQIDELRAGIAPCSEDTQATGNDQFGDYDEEHPETY